MKYATTKITRLQKGDDYFTAIVLGKEGSGKSSYCLQIAYEYFRYHGNRDDDPSIAWNKALDSMVFDINDIIKVYREHSYDNRKEILILDDASVHLGGARWLTKAQSSLIEMNDLLTTGRTSVQALLINCPQLQDMMRYVRKMKAWHIYIKRKSGGHPYDRIADVRIPKTYITATKGEVTYRPEAIFDEFSVYLPNWVFKKMMMKRDKYKDVVLNELETQGTKSSKKAYDKIKELNINE